jgi:uncharacterized protein (TIGR02722 family)
MAHGRAGSLALLTLAALLVAGCGKKVRRIDPDTTTDLSGLWNDTDSRIVSDEMIADCLSHPWIDRHHQSAEGDRPVVIIGLVRNRSTEHIPTGTFTRDLERAFVNSGTVRVVSDAFQREEIRGERLDQQDWSSAETRKRLREELGADYMLQGTIDVIIDQEGGRQVKYYQVDLYLTDIESNERVWIDQTRIKKEISRPRLGF